ncbi:hypothetical protein [Aquibacillus kalidii]|uniref:hypothetical protein n=1 Tax=Aquibacillus kalidii TaxID=2762597 RepID=UPI001645D17C|nr:hypothetical protein [Aquibacillus kalidii]
MKFIVNYVPLSKIKSSDNLRITSQMKRLHLFLLDSMHLLVVRKNKNENSYTIIYGQNRLQYLQKHEKAKEVPVIIANRQSVGLKALLQQVFNKDTNTKSLSKPTTWSIVKTFLKKEPRFKSLSFTQKLKVLMLAVRYKNTVVNAMRNEVKQYWK